MEIKLKNLSCETLQQLNIVLAEKKIIAVTGEEKELFLNILHLKEKVTGTIYIDGKRLLQKNKICYRSSIYLVKDNLDYPTPIATVGEYLHFMIQKLHLSFQNEEKKIKDALHLVGLQEEMVHRSLLALSCSEKKLLRMSEALLVNPEVFLLENPFDNLDYKNIKKLVRIFNKLKEKYQKTIVFTTDNCEEIYQYADDVIILKKGTVLLEGTVSEVYSNKMILEKEKISVPKSILFSDYVQEKKGIHLDYYKDIRDLIKEIYRKI